MPGGSSDDLDERRPRDEVHRGAPPGGARVLNAILPNGRVVWLRVATPLAPAVSLNHLAHLAESGVEWRRASIHAQSEAIERSANTLGADAERLEQARLDRAKRLGRRIVDGDDRMDRRLSKAAAEFRSRIERQLKIERETVRRLRRRDLWDKIVILTSLPLFAAYGQQGNPLGANNLTLALSLLVWLVGDEVVEALFGSDEKSPYFLRDADAWSYLAPIGNVLAAWWLLGDQQHERFITGFTPVKLDGVTPLPHAHGRLAFRYTATVDVANQVAPDHRLDFQSFIGVPAVATFREIRWSAHAEQINARVGDLTAAVEAGQLILAFTIIPDKPRRWSQPSPLGEVDIAWMVDTADPSTSASKN